MLCFCAWLYKVSNTVILLHPAAFTLQTHPLAHIWCDWLCFLYVASPPVKDPSPEELLRQLQEERTCKVCMDKLVSIVFIPCGHLVVCGDCAASLRHCPICRAVIRGSVRAFMSWGCSEKPLLYRCCMSGLEFSSVLIISCTDKNKDCCWLLVLSEFYRLFSSNKNSSCPISVVIIHVKYSQSVFIKSRHNCSIKRAHSFINKHLFTLTQSTVRDK